MMEIQIAPTFELIRYLCLFHRTFEAMRMFVKAQDEDGVYLMAWIADAIHNVPAMLWRHEATGDGWTEQTAAWLNAFPQTILECAPPDPILAVCNAIFSLRGAARELGLADDLHDLDLAPPEKLATYIDLCYYACLAIRWRQSPRTPWRKKDRPWRERQAATTIQMGEIAEILTMLPIGLTHWHDFDEEQFTLAVRSLWPEWPVGFGLDRLRRYQADKEGV